MAVFFRKLYSPRSDRPAVHAVAELRSDEHGHRLGAAGSDWKRCSFEPRTDGLVRSVGIRNSAAYTYGNSGRNILYGPGFHNLDLGASRTIDFAERFHLEFQAEAFNLFNTP